MQTKILLILDVAKAECLRLQHIYGFKKLPGLILQKNYAKKQEKILLRFNKDFLKKYLMLLMQMLHDYKIENDTNVFFFFNPFDEVIMLAVVKNILDL